ncbi:hypothetical protein [Paraburkholderia kururiensis]|uniref:hypothetical protein n=1 Tax=Paraburkholderia kururiensis TaxID=984307 RepID=UPI0018F5BD55|nr:hypothetical protein [Paraburkholderia kururiensis]
MDLGLCHAPKISVAWAVIRQPLVTGQRNQISYPGRPDADSTLRGHSSYAALNWRLFDFGVQFIHICGRSLPLSDC